MYQLAPGRIQRDTPSDYAALTFKNECLPLRVFFLLNPYMKEERVELKVRKWALKKIPKETNSILTARRFHSLFHSPWNWCPEQTGFNQNGQVSMLVTQAGRVLFIVPLRYLFAIGFQNIMDEHQYLAFDVSLPPPIIWAVVPNNSTQTIGIWIDKAISNCTRNVTVTLYGVRRKYAFQRKWTFSVQEKSKKINMENCKITLCNTNTQRKKELERRKKCHATIPSCRHTQEYATRIDYHCGLNQSKQTRRKEWLLVRSLFARR